MRKLGAFLLLIAVCAPLAGIAQELDLSDPGLRPGKTTSPKRPTSEVQSEPAGSAYYMRQPLKATVSKKLYLPSAMYGQWNIVATRVSTNFEDFPPSTTDIWILERRGDLVTVTNPSNGAMAVLNVTDVKDNRATIVRQLSAPQGYESEEILQLTVEGDRLYGQDLRKIRKVRHGKVLKEYFGLYQFSAQRIGGARAIFRPEAEAREPDIEIEDPRPQYR